MIDLPFELLKPATAVPPHISFRLAQEADRRPLHTACYSHYTAPQFRDLFNHLLRRQVQGRCFWLIIMSHNRIIGNGQLIVYPSSSECATAECANLFVVSDYRGQGIGTALIELLTAVARHVGIYSLELGVTTDNPRAFALYQRLGFAEDRRLYLPDSQPFIILHKVIKIGV